MNVVIVGAGIGGLTCAIACRRANPPLNVTVVEKAPELLAVGAGIHIPPNSSRVLSKLGLFDYLLQEKAYEIQDFTLRRYETGKILANKPLGDRCVREFGSRWLAIHRGDYQHVLLEGAKREGVNLMLNSEVTSVEPSAAGGQTVSLKDGRHLQADVVVGADGLWSLLREIVIGHSMPPKETGDLAYRGTFSRQQLESFNDEKIDELIKASNAQVWLGPDKHAVFYPLRNHTEYNLVLLCADDLPEGVRTSHGTVDQMAATFEGWDPSMSAIISSLKTALKWKLLHFKELDTWTKGTIALLGDASHPTLPYQGQGAAMAVEGGAVIGLLLSKMQQKGLSSDLHERDAQLSSVLKLYESLRKKRTEVNVQGAVSTRVFYHLNDGPEQEERDRELDALNQSDWSGPSRWVWADAEYQRDLLGFDVLVDAERRFEEWYSSGSKP